MRRNLNYMARNFCVPKRTIFNNLQSGQKTAFRKHFIKRFLDDKRLKNTEKAKKQLQKV